MGIFTIHSDSKIDEKIQKDLGIITNDLLQNFKGILAVYLVGGFGRGEGGVLLDDNNIAPVNDYDIEVVAEKYLDKTQLNRLEKALASKLKISYVHIESHKPYDLETAKPTIYFYDLKYGSKLLHGDEKLLNILPQFRASNIKLIEAFYLLMTRITSLLLAWENLFEHPNPSRDSIFFATNQLSKTLLACLDANLIINKKYTHLYSKRIEEFQSVQSHHKSDERLLNLFNWAIGFKLAPNKTERVDFYEVLSIYRHQFVIFSEQYFGKTSLLREDINHLLFSHPKSLIRRFYFLLYKQTLWYEKYLRHKAAGWELLNSIKPDGNFEYNTLKNAAKYLKTFPHHSKNIKYFSSLEPLKRGFINLKNIYNEIMEEIK